MTTANGVADLPPEPTPPDPPTTSIQSQLGLLITALLTVSTFIWHVDLGNLAAPLSVLAFAIYGAAVAIARAWKQHTYHQAVAAYHSQRLDAWTTRQAATEFAHHDEVQKAFHQVAQHIASVEEKVDALTPAPKKPRTVAKKTARKAAAPRKTARKSTRTRRLSATY